MFLDGGGGYEREKSGGESKRVYLVKRERCHPKKGGDLSS